MNTLISRESLLSHIRSFTNFRLELFSFLIFCTALFLYTALIRHILLYDFSF